LHPAPYSPKSQSEETNEIILTSIITMFCTTVQNREENTTKEPA